ncbi:hypothetical protein BAE44_0012588 [Dichanthelium oligosanthes]|uniref:Uncharacterized protein n=1 Tax=Dichanthelium oligosanthes TaxID=888268 RepID=A0A1E5VMP6_9POAL|nr:hypothetical protein BAE44_0012588 [Dichanthelium oligosanthes]
MILTVPQDARINRYRSFAEGVMIMVCPVLLAVALNKVELTSVEHGRVLPIIMLVVAAVTLVAGICPFLTCFSTNGGACTSHCGQVFRTTVQYVPSGLALEGQINRPTAKPERLTKPMGASFFACVVGVCIMLLETIPPPMSHQTISNLTTLFDILVTIAISLPMFFIIQALMKLEAFLLFASPFFIFLILAFFVGVNGDANNENNAPPDGSTNMPGDGNDLVAAYKPASLELTKVAFTGFLAVSITSISKDSLNKSTHGFIHLTAQAIVSGLIWRLLSHVKSDNYKKAASIASYWTHLIIVMAAIPFTIMAANALY